MFGNKEKKEKRFIEGIIESQGAGMMYTYTDIKTGVQYLTISNSSGFGGITVLMDENGKPLIDEDYKKEI